MSILPFIRKAADFDDEATTAMGEAFDQACAAMATMTPVKREIIALRIVEAAKTGERDVDALCRAGLATLDPT